MLGRVIQGVLLEQVQSGFVMLERLVQVGLVQVQEAEESAAAEDLQGLAELLRLLEGESGEAMGLLVLVAVREDLGEAFRWYEARGKGLGHEFMRAVRVAFGAIERAPEQFALAVDDIRRARLRRFPYLIYFVILARHISVIGVLHGRRHSRRWQSRR